jgi:hypothetical protein
VAARFFVDENDLALGKALAQTHDGVIYPGHADLPEVREEASMTTGSRSSVSGDSS